MPLGGLFLQALAAVNFDLLLPAFNWSKMTL
jgi:hypothetical protein